MSSLDEARVLAGASHPNVVVIHDVPVLVDPADGASVEAIVMEHVQGTRLQVLLERQVSQDDGRRIARGVLAGLGHLHSLGMSHGDMHEGNVIVATDQVKLIDVFYNTSLSGIATLEMKQRQRRDVSAAHLMLVQVLSRSEVCLDAVETFRTKGRQASTAKDLSERLEGALHTAADRAGSGASATLTSAESRREQLKHALEGVPAVGCEEISPAEQVVFSEITATLNEIDLGFLRDLLLRKYAVPSSARQHFGGYPVETLIASGGAVEQDEPVKLRSLRKCLDHGLLRPVTIPISPDSFFQQTALLNKLLCWAHGT